MSLRLTENARAALAQITKEPNIVLEIEGYGPLFGASLIKQYVRIGGGNPVPDDPQKIPNVGDPEIDPLAFYIGGFNLVSEQQNIITLDGTSTSITQSLNIDRGQGSSISSLSIALIDDGFMTDFITPGKVLPDVLQRRAKVYFGFRETAWPEDYVIIFRGVITDIQSDAGKVIFQISHPDDKKRSTIYKQVETTLVDAIDNTQTSGILLATRFNILTRIQGPDGTYDPAFVSYIRVGDELIEFEDIGENNELKNVTRGALGTTPAAHDSGDQVTTFYRLRGGAIELALKIMASGRGGYFIENYPVKGINTSGARYVPNSVFFSDTDIVDRLGINVGDYITITDPVNAENNVTLKQITDIVSTDLGDFAVVDAELVDFSGDGVYVSVRSQFDTLPDGLKMHGDEIDVVEHERLRRLFLSSVNYDFYIKETIEDAKEFIEQQIYSPMAAYSLPRKSRASIGYHIGPIPGQDVVVFNDSNIKNPTKIKIRRSTNRQFFNEIIYKTEEHPLENKFLFGFIAISQTSKNRIQGPNKTLTIEAKGLRQGGGAEQIAQIHSARRLRRYEFGAEVFTFDTLLKDAFNVEIGDIILFDGRNLQLPDIKHGKKGIEPRLLEVQNKTFQLKTGDIRIEAVDTNFATNFRYGLFSPASTIRTGIDERTFVIERSFNSRFGDHEFRKWERLVGAAVRIRSLDFEVQGTAVLVSASSNTIQVQTDLGFIPEKGMLMELAPYNEQPTHIKLIYTFLSDEDNDFADGEQCYRFL